MNENAQNTVSPLPGRAISVDFFRGLTMLLLVGESARLYSLLVSPEISNGFLHFIGTQFHHHEWHGLNFWDLIQPFFMFIVGVAIPFSVANRLKRGDSQKSILIHAVKRSLLLLFFGWALGCIGSGKIVFHFQNVLAQLSVTYLVAFLIMRKSVPFQVIFTLAVLLIIDIAYRIFPVEGFNQPFVPDLNLGAWVDMKISGDLSSGHWVSLNAIPTIAHTVWGVLCGRLLLSEETAAKKIRILLIAGVIALIAGFSLDYVTPIIKRIATSSFVLASGGWAILVLCFSYWIIDVKKITTGIKIFTIVGMNSLFIYLFANVGGGGLVSRVFIPFSKGLFSWGGNLTVGIVNGLVTWAALWYICYWLYKNKVFIRI